MHDDEALAVLFVVVEVLVGIAKAPSGVVVEAVEAVAFVVFAVSYNISPCEWEVCCEKDGLETGVEDDPVSFALFGLVLAPIAVALFLGPVVFVLDVAVPVSVHVVPVPLGLVVFSVTTVDRPPPMLFVSHVPTWK